MAANITGNRIVGVGTGFPCERGESGLKARTEY
jgi:hypothetical protein